MMALPQHACITAPFNASVSARYIVRGALVGTGTATPLFKLVITDPVRVMVEVPQAVAPSVRRDVPAKVPVHKYGDRPSTSSKSPAPTCATGSL